jgi:hypothetical protein
MDSAPTLSMRSGFHQAGKHRRPFSSRRLWISTHRCLLT